MRRIFTALIALIVLVAPAAAAPLKPGELNTADAALRWMNQYRFKPELSNVPDAVKAMSDIGAFRDPDTSGAFIGFIAGILGGHPDRADELLAKMLIIPAEDHWALVRAIAYSGHPDWKGLMSRAAERMPTRRAMIDQHLAGKLPTLADISYADPPGTFDKVAGYLRVDKYFSDPEPKKPELSPSPNVLDTLWGTYLATGRFEPISRIVLMLPWSKEMEDAERLTTGSMAKFTLATNAARDSKLLFRLKAAKKVQPKAVVPVLDEVIAAAETAETGKIKKDALVALEDFKRKGPQSRRNVAWWGQVGEGAIAVGCIAAAAVGTVALGLPCVVGGAVTSAGLRYLGSQ